MKTRIAVIGLSMFLPSLLFAADNTILGDLTIKPGDSPLVRAAKQTAEWRLTLKVHASTVIDNYTLRTVGGHFAEANQATATLPGVPSADTPAPAASEQEGLSPQQRARMAGQIQNLNLEHAVMAEEADQPYGGDYSEDLVTKRMTEIPGQINQIQTQLGSSAPPAYQPTQPAPVGNSLPQAPASNPTPTSASSPPPL